MPKILNLRHVRRDIFVINFIVRHLSHSYAADAWLEYPASTHNWLNHPSSIPAAEEGPKRTPKFDLYPCPPSVLQAYFWRLSDCRWSGRSFCPHPQSSLQTQWKIGLSWTLLHNNLWIEMAEFFDAIFHRSPWHFNTGDCPICEQPLPNWKRT